MRTALFLALLSGLLLAQYQNYPKFYTSPSQTWETDKLDTVKNLWNTSVEDSQVVYRFVFTDREDNLESCYYWFIDNRLQRKRFLFGYHGNLDSTFYIADRHNKGLLWLYMKDPQPFIVTDSGRFWKRYSKPEIISYLKNESIYENRYSLSQGDVIDLKIWYYKDLNRCYAELVFTSREFIRKEGD